MSRYRIRKLTEKEVLRLQGVSEANIEKICTSGLSKSRIYCAAGNSICIPCLVHIFRKMFIEKEPEQKNIQLSLFD